MSVKEFFCALILYNINIPIFPVIQSSLDLERVQWKFLWLVSYLFKIEIPCTPHDFAPVANMLDGLSSLAEPSKGRLRVFDMMLNVKTESLLIIYFKVPQYIHFGLLLIFMFYVPPVTTNYMGNSWCISKAGDVENLCGPYF